MGDDAITRRRRTMRRRRYGRIGLTFAVLLFVAVSLLALLAMGTSPSVTAQSPADPQELAAARAFQSALAETHDDALSLDSREVAGLAAMARQTTGNDRLTLDVIGSGLVARASNALPLGLWLNTSAQISGGGSGPGLDCSVGRIDLPDFACGWLWSTTGQVPGLGRSGLPPIEQIRGKLAASDGRLRLRLAPSEALAGPNARAPGVDFALAKDTYCRLARAQQSRPAPNLEALLRRSFLPGVMVWDARNNRATLVAVAVLVVGKPAFLLLPGAESIVEECPLPNDPILLRASPELAKRWAYAAGLRAAFGSQAVRDPTALKPRDDEAETAMLSFGDIVAARAGADFADRAVTPASAHDTAAEFSLVSQDELLPPSLLAAPAALQSGHYVAPDGTIDTARYAEAANSIDRKLAEMR